MMAFIYGSLTSDGIHVDPGIQHSLGVLDYLVSSLDSRGYQLMSYNTEGILVKYKDPIPMSPPTSPPPLPIDEEPTIIYFKEAIVGLEDRINNIPVPFDEPAAMPEVESKSSTGFYLLYEFLPEKLKDELKIYIRK
jgi:hypothetical protein